VARQAASWWPPRSAFVNTMAMGLRVAAEVALGLGSALWNAAWLSRVFPIRRV